jgi:hypothetical protein
MRDAVAHLARPNDSDLLRQEPYLALE